ncbi:ABC transporter ATP-binding protein [Kitasatospora sp. NPDC096147]|uniref:ABC transporter ATP-binding protein n=1 Tax=Kitasatospora sp. NPDC096147 TaxID=3364093 RepID=UPI00382043D1
MPVEFTSCSYRHRRGPVVLDGLDLRLPAGRTVLLGPNGAGKSTLLSLAASALRPQRGSVRYDGLDPADRRSRGAYRRRVGWLPQAVQVMPRATAREQVAYAGWLKGMARRAAWDAAGQALERVGLTAEADRGAGALSGGQLRRVGIAQALVHSADLILMDEPTAGLDPRQRVVFREVVRELSTRHVVVSTHQTDDLDELFDHVVVLEQGQVRFLGTVAEFGRLAASGTPAPRRAEAAYGELLRDGAGR